MRLYLSSDRLGDRAGSLLALLGSGSRAAVISNALDLRAGPDMATPDPSAELAGLGIASSPLDLRDFFGDPRGLARRLAGTDLVWVRGGNTFVLRRAMKLSGFDELIVDLLDRDEVAYGASGAGTVVAGPSLEGIEHFDDPQSVPERYDPEPVWDGLGLIDHVLVPHYRSPHPESAAAGRVVRQLAHRGRRYRALHDGEVVVWTEDRSGGRRRA